MTVNADVTFRTLEIAEALQSKTLFSHGRPVSGRTGHWLIWTQWFEMESGREKERSVAIVEKCGPKKRKRQKEEP